MNTTERQVAEQYLDEMLQGEASDDFELFITRFEAQDLTDFGPSKFKKEMFAIREELGEYRSREFFGILKGYEDVDNPDKHPNCVRYVWKGVFEKNEAIITVGIHCRDGVFYVNENMYR